MKPLSSVSEASYSSRFIERPCQHREAHISWMYNRTASEVVTNDVEVLFIFTLNVIKCLESPKP